MLKIYTKLNCPNCDIVKGHCALRGISYIEIHIDNPEAIKEFKEKFPNARALPFVCDDNGVIGGFSAFKEWLKCVN